MNPTQQHGINELVRLNSLLLQAAVAEDTSAYTRTLSDISRMAGFLRAKLTPPLTVIDPDDSSDDDLLTPYDRS